jgi:hypothetical protein
MGVVRERLAPPPLFLVGAELRHRFFPFPFGGLAFACSRQYQHGARPRSVHGGFDVHRISGTSGARFGEVITHLPSTTSNPRQQDVRSACNR